LDVMSSRAVRDLIAEMKRQGHCILISRHIMSEVVTLCDRLVIAAEGRLIAQGTPNELRAQELVRLRRRFCAGSGQGGVVQGMS